MGKKLYKSSLDRKICGVCGGFAEFFGIDATILRLLVVLFTLAGGSGKMVDGILCLTSFHFLIEGGV